MIFHSALKLAQAVRKREISAEEVINYFLRQIEVKEAGIKAFITVCADQALEQAQALDPGRSSGSHQRQYRHQRNKNYLRFSNFSKFLSSLRCNGD